MLIIVGPSASGKTQIVNELIKNYQMEKLVTYTSRPKRIGEVDGKDYHFITKEEFMKKIENDFFIETVFYNNNYYGTSKSDLGENKVVILEPSGLMHYLKKVPDKVKVVYLRCSKEVIRLRMIKRGDKIEDIKKRLEKDDDYFSSIIHLCDKVIDTTMSNVYDDAKTINDFYRGVCYE